MEGRKFHFVEKLPTDLRFNFNKKPSGLEPCRKVLGKRHNEGSSGILTSSCLSFIHLFIKFVSRSYYVAGIMLGNEDKVKSKKRQGPCVIQFIVS